MLAALRQFGFGSLDISRDDLSRPGQVIQFGVKPNRIDLITSLSGVDFESAWTRRVQGAIDGAPVMFIGRDDLIRNKESTGRKQDAADADALRKRGA